MEPRINYSRVAPGIYQAMFALGNYLKNRVRQKKSWVDSGSGSLPSEW